MNDSGPAVEVKCHLAPQDNPSYRDYLSLYILTFVFFFYISRYKIHQFLKVNPGQKVQFFSKYRVFIYFFSQKVLFKNHLKIVGGNET